MQGDRMRKLLALVVLVLVGVMSEAQATIGSGQWLHDGWGSARKVDKSSTDYALAFVWVPEIMAAVFQKLWPHPLRVVRCCQA